MTWAGIVVHAFDPSTQKVEADGSVSSKSHSGLHSKYQSGQG